MAAAKQITQHPLNPYGFEIVWDTTRVPMSDVTQNPPLACYYIALIARLAGWSERGLHLGFIPVAIALILGTFRLAEKFTGSPLLAALCALLTPGVLVSASSVMCDTLMVAIWVWAAWLWIEGLDKGKSWMLALSGVLAGASALTKYFGISLVLLLLAYSIARFRRLKILLLFLLIPVAMLYGYELWTTQLYGHGMLEGAAQFAESAHDVAKASSVAKALVGLSYTGGCTLLGLSFAFLIWSRKQLALVAAISAIAGFAITAHWLSLGYQADLGEGRVFRWFADLELILFIAGGMLVLWLVTTDLWTAKNCDSLFLALWVGGTFVFAAFVNWSVNARSVLPLIPAAAILVARNLESSRRLTSRPGMRAIVFILLGSAFISLWITAADSELADAARTAANRVYEKTRVKGAAVWFIGHWGFQHYMESLGASALDPDDLQAHSGDFVIIPRNNTHLGKILPQFIAHEETFQIPIAAHATTISSQLGAGFYSSYWGPLPYVMGPVPPESYTVTRLGNLPVQRPN